MESIHNLEVVSCYDLPENPDTEKVYSLLPKNADEAYYWERVDRNIGWITRDEQSILRQTTIGIAGCGGMGGQLAQIFARLGIGEIRIADCEAFDISNINRQFAAGRRTVGKSKAFSTARLIRSITDDTELVVYPQGITEKTVGKFLEGCDVICDEIEFWSVGARLLLHRSARAQNIPVFVCDTIGFASHLFLFTPWSATMEECIKMSYEEARVLEQKIRSKTASENELRYVMENMLRGLFAEWPEYGSKDSALQNRETQHKRLMRERKAPIVATNPPLASGFLADRVLLYCLRNSGVPRDIVQVPEMPGYLYIDVARMEAKVVRERWW